jgi:hypothetical protein
MQSNLTVHIFSFGFQKSGIPHDRSGNGGGFVFDCRHLPNPGREEKYRYLTGQDEAVIEFFKNYPVVDEFLEDTVRIVDRTIQNYIERGFDHLMVSYGCTGGQHRSVFSAERLNEYLQNHRIRTILEHTEMQELRLRIKMLQARPEPMEPSQNAGVTNSKIIFCEPTCEFASFPKDEAIDGAKSCRTFSALWCGKLNQYVTKNAPCSWRYGKRRPKAGW